MNTNEHAECKCVEFNKDILDTSDCAVHRGNPTNEHSEWEAAAAEIVDSTAELKKSLGEIPENTCPDIDNAQSELAKLLKDFDYLERSAHHYETGADLVKDFPNYGWLDTPDILEKLRADNDQLRHLGREWYQHSKELHDKYHTLITTLLQREREAAYGHAEIVRQRDIQAILTDLKNSGDLSAKDAARIAEEYNIQL